MGTVVRVLAAAVARHRFTNSGDSPLGELPPPWHHLRVNAKAHDLAIQVIADEVRLGFRPDGWTDDPAHLVQWAFAYADAAELVQTLRPDLTDPCIIAAWCVIAADFITQDLPNDVADLDAEARHKRNVQRLKQL
jgi:hypothetical protein